MTSESTTKKRLVLVTGGSGFIGTHLCRHLADQGFMVRSLDLRPPQQESPMVESILGDVRDPSFVEKALRDCDGVIHLAAIASVPLCQERPVESYETNQMATSILLEAVGVESARSKRDIVFVFSSSSAVYGDRGLSDRPAQESDAPSNLRSNYAAQKLTSEEAIREFHSRMGLPCVVFRFFNVFGPGQDPTSPYTGVISIFLENIRNGRPLRLNDGGRQTRDFVSVLDVVRACTLALNAPKAASTGDAINIATGQSVTIRELAQTVLRVSGKSLPLETAPPRQGDILNSLADVTRARQVLGWEAEVSLEQGLRELVSNWEK